MARRSDLLVIGGGVMGLSVAEAAARTGLSVTLAEAAQLGAGASGGPVGALVPFGPRSAAPMKALQLQGLRSLPEMATRLAQATGLDPGYRRTGRLAPLPDEAALRRAEADILAAREIWPKDANLRLLPRSPDAGWLDPAAAPCGVLADDLSARVTPALWLAALRAAAGGGLELREGWRAERLDAGGRVRFDRGTLAAGHVVVAAGSASLALLAPFAGPAGRAVPGQALLLEGTWRNQTILTQPGLWIVPHRDGVGVGSTRERTAGDDRPSGQLGDLLARARTLSPALRGARVLRRWAGIRPQGPSGRLIAGPVPGAPRLIAATGAGGIGFAVAHIVAEAIVGRLCGREESTPLPCIAEPPPQGTAQVDAPPAAISGTGRNTL